MDNTIISENFSLLAKLMDIHGDNSFKARSYATAAFTINKLPSQLSELPLEKIFSIRGIGDAIGKNIVEQLETGELSILKEYLQKTPAGILDMLGIKGIGPKKIATIWKELEIESLGELLYACDENRLTLYKGFGEKSQQNIKEAIEFYLGTLGNYLFEQIESFAATVDAKLKTGFPNCLFAITGELRRQMEIIHAVEWVSTATTDELKTFFANNDFETISATETYISFRGKENVTLGFHCTQSHHFISKYFQTSCSEEFLVAWDEISSWDASFAYESEDTIFAAAHINPISPFQREKAVTIHQAKADKLPDVIQPGDIKGIIHSHSNWSDGANTLEQLANAAIEKGFEYLVISDHSKSAFYANGLSEERIGAQHRQIDELNARFNSFRIFKSIESDILNDGSLDYSDQLLASFDLVIASVHSNLKMNEEKAMMRLLRAIENPFTDILGHMTGRLLLSRNGYPINHRKIIEACAANQVVIELNAHPRRLDIDWRWIDYALEKNVLISINPDAHAIDGFDDCRYGVLVAQKAGLIKEKNLSSFSLQAIEKFIEGQQIKRKAF